MTIQFKATAEKNIFSYRTKHDIKFMYRLHLGKDALGKHKNTTARGFDSLTEASRALETRKQELANSQHDKPELFKYLVAEWLPTYKKTVESTTYDKTVSQLTHHVLPVMGHLKLAKIDPKQCSTIIDEFSRRVKAFEKLTAYASRILDYAVFSKYLANNPFKALPPTEKKGIKGGYKSKPTVPQRSYFTMEEVNLILDCLKQQDNYKVYTFFRVLAYTGCRKSEALALTWEDINFNAQKIHFTKAVGNSKEKNYMLSL